MASSLRLPAGSFAPSARSSIMIPQPSASISHIRSFSQVPQRWAIRSQNFNAPSMTQPSMKTRAKEVMRGQAMPNDIGLLPGTFVRPLWRDMPSIFKEPKNALRMQWTWMKSVFQNFASLVKYTRWDMKSESLLWGKRRQIVRQLHEDMYTALARGDVRALRALCCDGLATKLVNQVERRPPNQKVTWSRDGWLRQPDTFFRGIRILSDRATAIPEIPNSGIRQIIFRVTSRQTMGKATLVRHGPRKTELVEEPKKVQDCREYIVIQHLIWNGKPAEWRVWGHANPTTMHTVLTDPFFAPGLKAWERFELIKAQMGGSK